MAGKRSSYPYRILITIALIGSMSAGLLAPADELILYGRFAWYIEGEDIDKQLLNGSGVEILPEEVPTVYGTPDGMTIYEGGIEVCSWEYAAVKGLPEPLKPVGMDLSDSAGWPDIHIPPGTVAIDPHLGRFYFAEGDADPSSLTGSAWTGFGVPGSGFIKLQGGYAFMPAGEGEVQSIDVSNPSFPQVVDNAYGDFNYSLEPYGDYLYLYRNNRGMCAIDIIDPTNLDWYPDETLARVWEAPDNLRLNAIDIRDDIAYVTVGAEPGFYALDLSDPLNAIELDSLNVGDPKGAQWVFLSGDRAYVGLSSANGLLDSSPYTHRWTAGFVVIDISDPSDLSVMGTYLGEPEDDIYTVPRLIGVSGDLAIMATKWRPGNYPPEQPAKLVLVDASDPSDITRRGEYAFMDGENNESHVDLYSAVPNGDYVYISDNSYDSTGDSLYLGYTEDYTTLFTFDISDPDNPSFITRYNQPEPSRYRHLTREGSTLYVNDYNYGVRTFSLTDPANPVPLGGTDTAAEGRFSWVNDDGTEAYFSQTYGGTIHTFNIQEPVTITHEGTYWDGQWNEKQGLHGRGDQLYVPTTTQISILDMSGPTEATKIGSFPSAINHSTISLFGDFAYVLTMADSSSPIRSLLNIYDITDPSTPTLTGELDLVDRHEKIFAQGDYTYVVADENLKIIDVSDESNPILQGELVDANLTVETRDEGGRMWVKDGYAYIITGERNERLYHIVDVSDPSSPVYVSTFSYDLTEGLQQHHVTGIVISGKYLYMGIYWGSFAIFDITDPLTPVYVEDGKALPLDFEGWNASWSPGRLSGENLVLPTLSHLRLIDVPRDSQALTGAVTVTANLGEPTAVGLLNFEARSEPDLKNLITAPNANGFLVLIPATLILVLLSTSIILLAKNRQDY